MSGSIRLVEIKKLRKIPASDLQEIIRARGEKPRASEFIGAHEATGSAQQPCVPDQFTHARPARTPGITPRLVGKALLDKVKELDGYRKSELVRQCGYTQRRSDGSLRLNYTAFFEALLKAKQAKQVEAKTPARAGRRNPRPAPVVVANPAGLKADDLLRVPAGRRLNPAAQARREVMAEALREQEEKQEQRRKRREERLAERRRLLGLDEPEAPEDMMRIAIRAGAPGSKR